MFGTDPFASTPIAATPDPNAWRQGAITAAVIVSPKITANSNTLPKVDATVTVKPGK